MNINYNYKRKYVIGSAIALLFIIAVFFVFSDKRSDSSSVIESAASEKAETINVDANYITYNDVTNLEQAADLIIIGTPNEDFEEREHITTYFGDGAIQDFYTVTNIKVDKIIKGSEGITAGQTLNVLEPIGYAKPKEKERKITREEYFELIKDEQYLIYLIKNDQGQYFMLNINNGKFNIKKEEKLFDNEIVKEKHEKLKKEVFSKYKIKE